MRLILFSLFFISFITFGAERKVSSKGYYYSCLLERNKPYKKNEFKKEIIFPVPEESDESYEAKINNRQIKFSFKFSYTGKIQYKLEEFIPQIKGFRTFQADYQIKDYQKQKAPAFSFLINLDSEHMIEYSFSCR